MFKKPQKPPGMDARVLHLTTTVALAVALIIAVMVPLSVYYYGVQFARGNTSVETEINAKLISQVVGRNPGMWQFETLRIDEILSDHSPGEIWRVIDNTGNLVTSVGQSPLPGPSFRISVPFLTPGLRSGVWSLSIAFAPS